MLARYDSDPSFGVAASVALGSPVLLPFRRIELCLTWENDDLKVTDSGSRWSGGAYNYSYRVLSATGAEVTLEVQTSDVSAPSEVNNAGPAYFKLNEDDTIDERWESTTYFSGTPVIWMQTTAQLRRSPVSPVSP
jgi:hypothetical protein